MPETSLPKLVPFPTKPIAVSAALTLVLLGWLTWSLYAGYLSSQDTSARLLRLSNARGVIVHIDEVLTMSAMMAAVTGEVAWIDRYKIFELELTAAIETALARLSRFGGCRRVK